MPTVEATPRLSLDQIRELPTWEEIRERGSLHLSIIDNEDEIELMIEIVFDGTPFGMRPWLSCPRCASRRKDLFLLDGDLWCRRCHRLLFYQQTIPNCTWREDVALPLLRAARNTE